MNMTQTTRHTLCEPDLHQFYGDDVRYRHPLNPLVIYTPGVQHVAEAGGAYWLIDAIASYYEVKQMKRAMLRDSRLEWQQFWRLEVDGYQALLTARADDGEKPFIRQKIPYTDFPLPSIDVWAGYDGRIWTLYLPSEH